MKIGIVGLPNVGKSTIFNALTSAGAESENYPFCTIDSNVGMVQVPDERLDELGKLYQTKKIVPTAIEFVDIAGLVKGASQGEGLGNKFLSHIREVDAICHVVRCFDDQNIVHVNGEINPVADVKTITDELILADLEILERSRDRLRKSVKNNKDDLGILNFIEDLIENFSQGIIPSSENFDEKELKKVNELGLISYKPVLYIANVAEEDLHTDNSYIEDLKEFIGENPIRLSAKIEEEIASLDPEERELFLEELGIDQSGLSKVITASYDLLGLMSFLTAGPDECRAWTIKKGTKAPQAAGKVHSDMERGFIRAEVTNYDDLIKYGSETKTKELGLTRIEGKDYILQDGDVVYFRFNV